MKVADQQPIRQDLDRLYGSTEHALCGEICVCCGIDWGEWSDEQVTVVGLSSTTDGSVFRVHYTEDDGSTIQSFSF